MRTAQDHYALDRTFALIEGHPPDILDRRNTRGDGSPGMIWMEIKPLSISGIARAGAAWALYSGALTGFSPDVNWLAGGRMFTVQNSPTLVFNKGGILFYTTSKEDYDTFEESIQAIGGLGAAVAIGAGAAQLANLIAKLPQVPVNPAAASEVIDIATKARVATTATQGLTETEVAADVLEDVI